MAARPCDECGGVLNARYPLRLVPAEGPLLGETKQWWVCLGRIGGTLDAFKDSGRTCAACLDLAGIFERVVTAVKGSIATGESVTAIHVPPNRVPHRDGCEHAA